MPDREARGGTLIVGGGFAGSYVARKLGRRGATTISPENFMLFTPMLPEAASGTLELRHVVVPIRVMCPHSDLVLGRAVAHDGGGRRVQVETEETVFWIRYDNLVVALGAVARTLPIPGLADHALGFKSLSDAIHLRNHVLTRLEVAATASAEAHRRRELDLRLRRRRLCGSRGACRARRPRPRRASLLPMLQGVPALGARRR